MTGKARPPAAPASFGGPPGSGLAPAGPIARIDAAALRGNLQAVRRLAPGSRILAAVKADAYGHGLVQVARELAAADAFGVARLGEALALRAAGVRNAIVLLEGVVDVAQLAVAREHELEIVVHSAEQLAMLEQQPSGRALAVWLKIDTGMNRLGFELGSAHQALERLRRVAGVGTVRVMSHLACAEQPDSPQTREQLQRFDALTQSWQLERSIGNSAALIDWPQARLDWVRPGLMLYGISPFAGRSAAQLGLRPAMTLTTQLIAVRHVAAGDSVGYGATWRAQRRSRIAAAAIGYGDGYPATTHSGAPVLVAGKPAVTVGRVSMDLTMIDLTDIEGTGVGDAVTLWGTGVPVEAVALFAGTISYELICRVGHRVARVWEETGSAPGEAAQPR